MSPSGSHDDFKSKIVLSMAKRPWTYYIITALITGCFGALNIGIRGFTLDDITFQTRGTTISKAGMQNLFLNTYRGSLVKDLVTFSDLTSKVWSGWWGGDGPPESPSTSRRLYTDGGSCEGWGDDPFDIYLNDNNLHGIWKAEESHSLLEADAIEAICKGEKSTFDTFVEKDVCQKCSESNECLKPFSLVFTFREYVARNRTDIDIVIDNDNGTLDQTEKESARLNKLMEFDCTQLGVLYGPERESFTDYISVCKEEMLEVFNPIFPTDYIKDMQANPDGNCKLQSFLPALVDADFDSNNKRLQYTTTIYPTDPSALDEVRKEIGAFDTGDKSILKGIYDTKNNQFLADYTEERTNKDLMIFSAGVFVAVLFVLINTKSPFLMVTSFLALILTFIFTMFLYHQIFRFQFFTNLNAVGIFIIAALGADDVFVCSDMFSNLRSANPHLTTAEIAVGSLPNAASAMILTTLTTAVGFLSNATSDIATIVCFGVFVGVLILVCYVVTVFMYFPALILHDRWMQDGTRNYFISFQRRTIEENNLNTEQPKNDDEEEEKLVEKEKVTGTEGGLSHRIIQGYCNYLHKFRWVMLAIYLAAIIISIIFATKLKTPNDSDSPMLPLSNDFRQHTEWQKKLLESEFKFRGQFQNIEVVWGVKPVDNGNLLNDKSLTTFVLDESFNPNSEIAQEYLLGFCDKMFNQNFVEKPYENYTCSINSMDNLLRFYGNTSIPEDFYNKTGVDFTDVCGGASKLPMAEEIFGKCSIAINYYLSGEGRKAKESNQLVLESDDKESIQVMTFWAQSKVPFTQKLEEIDESYNDFHKWFKNEVKNAPDGVDKHFFSSNTYWNYDTQNNVVTAFSSSIAISLCFSAVVIFFTTWSFPVTFFATISIGFIMAAVIASLQSIGWELGSLEAVCLTIVVGVSCDFIIHMSHAYSHHPGSVSSTERTMSAIISMGPSIGCSFLTTFIASLIMLLCEFLFFSYFGVVLVLTMLLALGTTFIGFAVVLDIFGPSEPSRFVEVNLEKLHYYFKKDRENV